MLMLCFWQRVSTEEDFFLPDCKDQQELTASTHQVDHVIAEKYGGQTVIENLALSCTVCNRRKGSDLSSLDPVAGTLVPLFNPRTQSWSTHFRLEEAHILGVTIEGRTTVAFLRLNAVERLMERTAFLVLDGIHQAAVTINKHWKCYYTAAAPGVYAGASGGCRGHTSTRLPQRLASTALLIRFPLWLGPGLHVARLLAGGGCRPTGTVPGTCFFIEKYGFEATSARMFGFRQMVYRLINSQC